jgi:hypothetical protein
VEITRKNEGRTEGTKFEKARGFVRSNWSSKNFQAGDNPLEFDTSTSEDEDAITVVQGRKATNVKSSMA